MRCDLAPRAARATVHPARADDDEDVVSLTESEIFRKFAFENDDNSDTEEGWNDVKPKKCAKEGCLPFCFEPNSNIFPDWEGNFRHYCKAEVRWRCRRKT